MAKKISLIFGIVLLVLGVLGFFNDPILGLFEVDTYHNSIYVILGIILLATATKNTAMGLKIVGALALIVSILGFIPPTTSVLGLVETNMASSILQLLVAIVLLGVSISEKKGGVVMKKQPAQEENTNYRENKGMDNKNEE